MPVIPLNYSQVNLKFTGAAVPRGAEVTFGVANTTSLSPTGVAACVEEALGDFTGWSAFSNLARITSILVKNGPNATGPFVEVPANSGGEGTGQPITPNVAVLVRKTTALGGRAGSGRMYWPGLLEGNVNGAGVLEGHVVAGLQDAFNAFWLSLETLNVPPMLLHGPGSPVSDDFPTVITAFNVDPVVATQRRRLR